MGAEITLGRASAPFSDIAHSRPLFRIDPVDGPSLHVENMFFIARYPGEVLFENDSPKPLVIRHRMGWVGYDGHRHSYRGTSRATGPLFIEDVFLPGWDFGAQAVWARQFNPENWDGDGSSRRSPAPVGICGCSGPGSRGPGPSSAPAPVAGPG